MYLLFSGEGPTDLGAGAGAAPVCEGEAFVQGPMALIADRVVEAELDYSVLEVGSCGIVSEHHLAQRSAELKAVKKALGCRAKSRKRRRGISSITRVSWHALPEKWRPNGKRKW